ncbi:MAG: M28 family peptidase [Actinomycetota bacterium]|nr:M28 family peptidase [Actinomycetota bacterium]
MSLPSKHVLYLSRRIGPRGAGSDREAAAASYILDTLGESGTEVELETFSCWDSDLHAVLVLYALSVVAYLLILKGWFISLILSIIALFLFQLETFSWSTISKLYPRSKALNVIGKVKPEKARKRLVVLVANYDTPKSSPFARTPRLYRFFYSISFLAMIVIALLSLLGAIAEITRAQEELAFKMWLLGSPFALFLLVFFLILLIGELRGKYTSGANDNASGVGVMLSVIASISARPLEFTEVWGVATARGNAGGRGMVELIRRHRSLLKNSYIINLDHLGRGKMNVLTREGAIFGFGSSRKLRKLAFQAASRSKDTQISEGKCRIKKSDALVAIARGYRAVTIGGMDDGAYHGWRSRLDTYPRIQRNHLDNAVKLLDNLLDEIDHETIHSPNT